MNDTQKWAIGGGIGAAILGGLLWSRGGTVLGPVGAVLTISGIVIGSAGVITSVATPKRRKALLAGESPSEVQSLIFPRDRFTVKQAWGWAKRNGFKPSRPDLKKNTIRLRQQSPKGFRRMRTKTLDSRNDVKAVIGWKNYP
jgi:hypothetical protein